jgi:glutamate-ammonia-ligase adenylyltransferase
METAWDAFIKHSIFKKNPKLESVVKDTKATSLLQCIFGCSPFLTQIILKYPQYVIDILNNNPAQFIRTVTQELSNQPEYPSVESLMQSLRQAKKQIALAIAIADITEFWDVQKVVLELSQFAEICLRIASDWLLYNAMKRGEVSLKHMGNPARDSGWIILAMGKLGAKELNYSSDIDLILLYDKDKVPYTGETGLQHFMSKLTQELVRIMQERTNDGYVFRTDIRLRPDPASTPPCMSVGAAMTYYETVGQNWERAALIKARPIAGDITAGLEFLKWISPFIWRKYLDFASITDIQSIKRQMDVHHQSELTLAGHNIKLGIGGIREIEFYTQIHQLIWGGKMPQLRSIPTVPTLLQLQQEGLISEEIFTVFSQSYWFLRKVEHRLQMIADQQTHTIPESNEDIERMAIFMGFESTQTFASYLLGICHKVHDIYIHSFKGQGALGTEGALVFTGVEPDPNTLQTLRSMGFTDPSVVAAQISGWHRGTRRATRTKRARELITEVTPQLLKAFGATTNPDQAFIKFDEFLGLLPAGVQLFSLFQNNPPLMDLIATIMGSAPALAETLSRHPNLLDAVITGQFYDSLPDKTLLFLEFSNSIFHAENEEDEIRILREFKNEKQFQVGVQLLTGRVQPDEAAEFLSNLADTILKRVLKTTEREFAKTYGNIVHDSLAIIALGKLGAKELTFGSDLDLIFIYNPVSEEVRSDGEKSFNPNVYYSRLCQRVIGSLTALTREGRLYEVDMRLRPSGNQGPIAVSFESFDQYFSSSAWTFERMALCKARVLTGERLFQKRIEANIHMHLCSNIDIRVLFEDIYAMRQKVDEQFATNNPWDIKYVRGGLMDLDFIAQFYVLAYSHIHTDLVDGSTERVLQKCMQYKILHEEQGNQLLQGFRLLTKVFFILRLCSSGSMIEETAPIGLKRLLSQLTQSTDFDTLKTNLIQYQSFTREQFDRLLDMQG